jgi:hypothetical protein
MFTAPMSSLKNRRTISDEEHSRLKRRLLALRSQYARLLLIIAEKGETQARRRKAETLEGSISRTELKLALSVVEAADEVFIRFGDILRAGKRAGAYLRTVATRWLHRGGLGVQH